MFRSRDFDFLSYGNIGINNTEIYNLALSFLLLYKLKFNKN